MNPSNWFTSTLEEVMEVYRNGIAEGLDPQSALGQAMEALQRLGANLPPELMAQLQILVQTGIEEGETDAEALADDLEAKVVESTGDSSFSLTTLLETLELTGDEELQQTEAVEEALTSQRAPGGLSKARGAIITEDVVEGSSGLAEDLESTESSSTLSYENEVDGVIVDLSRGLAADGSGAIDNLSGFSDVLGSSHGDYIVGDDANNHLDGAGGNDTLMGNDGADTLDGGNGSDSIVAGAGNDLLMGDESDTFEGRTGTDTVQLSDGSLSTSLQSNGVEAVDFSPASGVSIDGSGFENIASIYGSAGCDLFSDGGEVSSFDGGAGNDEIDIDMDVASVTTSSTNGFDDSQLSGIETLDFDGDGNAAVTLFGGTVDILDASDLEGKLTVSNTQNNDMTLIGGDHNDVISGGGGNDSIVGGMGDDTLSGGAGDDYLVFDGGEDMINGGSGNDTLNVDDGTASGTWTFNNASVSSYSIVNGTSTANITNIDVISFGEATIFSMWSTITPTSPSTWAWVRIPSMFRQKISTVTPSTPMARSRSQVPVPTIPW